MRGALMFLALPVSVAVIYGVVMFGLWFESSRAVLSALAGWFL